MSFYLTLPCTASKEQYPDNTIGNYCTLLAQNVELEGNWEIGLCEVIIPKTKFDLKQKTEFIYARANNRPTIIRLSGESFFSLLDLEELTSTQDFRFNMQQDKITLTVPDDDSITFKDKWFSNMLGLPQHIKGGKHIGVPRTNLQLAFIYIDIVESNFIGDSMVPCIRAVALTPNAPTIIQYNNIYYHNLKSNRFNTVRVDISDNSGRTLDFIEGLASITVHIRPKK